MRSTLPEIFQKNLNKSPQKQGGIYELQLTIDHRKSYRTKLINPHLNDGGITNPKIFLKKRSLLHADRYEVNTRRSLSLSYDSKTLDYDHRYGQQIDNVKVNIRKVQKEIDLAKAQVQDFIYGKNILKSQIKAAKQRQMIGIQQVEKQIQERINQLKNVLSTFRRETGMEIKMNKKAIMEINEELVDSCQIIKDIQCHRTSIKDLNF